MADEELILRRRLPEHLPVLGENRRWRQAWRRHPASGRHTGRRGHALIMVTIFSTLALGLWGIAFRATNDAILSEGFLRQREERHLVLARAMAVGAGLLETGEPPRGRYACIVRERVGKQRFRTTLVFKKVAKRQWEIEVRPSSASDLAVYRDAPTSF